MTKKELDFIGSMNMCDEISNEAYKKIVNHVEETEISDDCVSRKRIKQIVSNITAEYDTETIHIDRLMDEIDDLPPVTPTQSWIPVSERLPEEETDVLICNANKEIAISRGSYSTEIENTFIWYTSGWRFGEVIAWQPLPQAYEEKRGNEDDSN